MKIKWSRRNFLKASSATAIGSVAALAANHSIFALGDNVSEPAILGGSPAHSSGWQNWPQWDAADDPFIADVMRKLVWSRSKLVTQFEEEWAQMIGTNHCLAVVNGTNALSASLMQLDIKPTDEVIIAPYTFSASLLGVLYQKAMPIFADIDPLTYQINPEAIRAKITPRTKAILPVHICGFPSDMENIMKIAKEHNLFVVEDCCQAHLASIHGKKVGSFGNAGCFSFQTSKVLPIGEGGGITTDDADYKNRLYSYHNYGYDPKVAPGAYNSIAAFLVGNKIRMAEYQAAIGLCQLKKLETQNRLRNENGDYLTSQIKDIPGITPVKKYDGVDSVSYYMYPFIYDENEFKGLPRGKFLQALQAEGIPASAGYPNCPIYTQEFIHEAFKSDVYQKFYSPEELDFNAYKEKNHCPGLIQTFETSIWISSSGMFLGTKDDMNDIALALDKIYKNAEKIKNA